MSEMYRLRTVTSNQEFNDLKKILGLQQGKEYTSVLKLRYGRSDDYDRTQTMMDPISRVSSSI
jgi:hypothetical protein